MTHHRDEIQEVKNRKLLVVARELFRPLRRLANAVSGSFSYFFGSLYFDYFLAEKVKIYTGEREGLRKVAIFVAYSPEGLKDSHFISLDYLIKCDYDVVLVSNSAIKEQDYKRLVDVCFKIIVRPNFGYDFGAYRQGILSINAELPTLSKLLLINDSIWFPVDSNDWLAQAENLPYDLVGAASNFGSVRRIPHKLNDFYFDYKSDRKKFHYCSFALLLSPSIFSTYDFIKFWKSFPLTNDKDRTISRGEIGFSQWVIKRGFRHCETMNIAMLEEDLELLPLDILVTIFNHMIIPDSSRNSELIILREEIRCSLEAGNQASERVAVVKFILAAVARIGASYASPYLNIKVKKSMFLKKSPMRFDKQSHITMVSLLDSLTESKITRAIKLESTNANEVSAF